MNPNTKKLLFATLLTFITPIILAYLYFVIPVTGWLSAALINSGIAFFLIAYYRRDFLAQTLRKHRLIFYFPSMCVLGGCIVAIFFSSLHSNPVRVSVAGYNYYWILWVPVIEELVFRYGIGRKLRQLLGNLAGGYCSALCFSLTHSSPTIDRILAGEAGVVLGAFFLGLICEYLYVKSNNLLPCVAFHIVCNTTPVIFMHFDERWLNWLDFLYQTGA